MCHHVISFGLYFVLFILYINSYNNGNIFSDKILIVSISLIFIILVHILCFLLTGRKLLYFGLWQNK